MDKLSSSAKKILKGLAAIGAVSVPIVAGDIIGHKMYKRTEGKFSPFERKKAGRPSHVFKHIELEAGADVADSVRDFINENSLSGTKMWLGREIEPGTGPSYIPRIGKSLGLKPGAYLPHTNEAVMLHELGHAAMDNNMPGKALMSTAAIAPMVTTPAALASLIIGASKRNKKMMAAAPFLYLAGKVPRLIGEAAPSIMAYKHIKKKRGAEEARKSVDELGMAFGSYAVPVIGMTAGLGLAAKILRK